MGKLGVDSWLSRVGLMNPSAASANTTTNNKNRKKKNISPNSSSNTTIGVVAFEVAGLMSRTIHLWHSLSDDHILRLKADVFPSQGVTKLISDDDGSLLTLALSELLHSLRSLARSVALLGASRCSHPALQRFDTVFFFDLIRSGTDPYGLLYAGRKMERKVKKMERLVAATSNLYQELEVMAELEQTLRRMQVQASSDPDHRNNNCLADFRHKVAWQRQEVKSLRQASLWNRTYDYAVRLLARSLFNIVARINHVFGFRSHGAVDDVDDLRAAVNNSNNNNNNNNNNMLSRCHSLGPFFEATDRTAGGRQNLHRIWKKNKRAVSSRSFNGCIVGGADSSLVLPSCVTVDAGFQHVPRAVINAVQDADGEIYLQSNTVHRGDLFECLQKPLKAPPLTLGASALALHYANVIIVIENLATSPHLIGPDARDNLYGMLPSSIRTALRARLKSYAENLNSSFYDPILAAEWSEALSRILDWLAPLAHNMIRWQSERNFEHQHLVSSANVLLLQTLYFANQAKTEAAITELLVGLNYLWRFGRELNEKAILECASGRSLMAV